MLGVSKAVKRLNNLKGKNKKWDIKIELLGCVLSIAPQSIIMFEKKLRMWIQKSNRGQGNGSENSSLSAKYLKPMLGKAINRGS